MDLLLGIDMGTTHIKVATFNVQGHLHSLEMSRTKTNSLGVGQAVYDPQEIWDCVSALLRKATRTLDPLDRILSISVASMGEAGLFLDASGQPLTPIIPWFDVRGKEAMDEWYESMRPNECFAITGLNYNYIYSLFKMLWLKKHQPEIMERAAKWLCMPDFIYYCLTGEYATDHSIASRTMLFDVRKGEWSETLLDRAGFDKTLLPPSYASGTVIGSVSRKAADVTGLSTHTMVAVGGHDHICGSFAANVIEPGRVLDSSGTAESLIAVFRELSELDTEAFSGFNVGRHVIPDLYYMQGGVDSSGISIEWFLEQFAKMSYDEMIELARTSEVGAHGMFFVPHLRGSSPPVGEPYSKACFLGMRDYHTPADFLRSIHEGLCFEVAGILKIMEKALSLEFRNIHAIGGGSKNDLWMEIKSTVTNKPIEVPAVHEATLLGAALLGGVGVGVYRDHQEASRATYRSSLTYEPDPNLRERYGKLYETYHKILPLARQISQIMHQAED